MCKRAASARDTQQKCGPILIPVTRRVEELDYTAISICFRPEGNLWRTFSEETDT
jgi:hypothetical protein